jgi:hypothetical protein
MVNRLTTPRLSQNFTYLLGPKDGKNICNLVLYWTILHLNRSILYKLFAKVTMYFNMISMLVEDWIID